MNVNFRPIQIYEDYVPPDFEKIEDCLKTIHRTINENYKKRPEERRPSDIDPNIFQYAFNNPARLPNKIKEQLFSLKRIVVQEDVNLYWPIVFNILYPNSSAKEPDPIRVMSESVIEEMSRSIRQDFTEIEDTVDDSDDQSLSASILGPPSSPPPVRLAVSPEAKPLYMEFKGNEVIAGVGPSPIEIEDQALISQQEAFLEKLGRALFVSYLKPLIGPITKIVIETLKDKEPSETILALLVKLLPEINPKLPTKLLTQLVIGQVNAFEIFLANLKQNPEDRKEIGELIRTLRKTPIKGSTASLIFFIAENLLPDIAHDLMTATRIHLIRELINYIQKNPVSMEYMVEDPLKRASLALYLRLCDETVCDNFMEALHPLLIKIFFPDPANIDKLTKDIITSILYRIETFFEGLNQALASVKVIKQDKFSPQELSLNAFAQKLFSSGTIPATGGDIPGAMQVVLQEILMRVIFKKENEGALSESERCLTNTLSKLIMNFIKPLCSMRILHILIARIFEDSFSLRNPYDKKMPAPSQFDASDKQFSAEVDARIPRIAKQVIRLVFTNRVSQMGATLLLDLIPKIGEKVQQNLNRIFNSGSTLMPGVLAAQFLFQEMNHTATGNTDAELREHYIRKLCQAKPFYAGFHLSKMAEDSAWVKEELLKNASPNITKFLSKNLPSGTRTQILKLVKRIYSFAEHDLFMQIFLLHMLLGIAEALRVPRKKEHASAQPS